MSKRTSCNYYRLPAENINGMKPPFLPDGKEMPADASAAYEARLIAKTRGFFYVKEFAAAVGRNNQYIAAECHARRIKTMRGGKPYRIPFDEYDFWLCGNKTSEIR